MASVHLGRLVAPGGFARTVAIKRLHQHLANDPDFVAMFLDEARIAARIQHPNVVATLDVVSTGGEFFVVMDYVHGLALARISSQLRKRGERIPLDVVAGILSNVLHGLHAAHEATSESGQPLSIVHRDVSPQNVMVGLDGIARVLDFGIAKAAQRLHTTRDGRVRGSCGTWRPSSSSLSVSIDARTSSPPASCSGSCSPADRSSTEILQLRSGARMTGEIEAPSRIEPSVPASLDRIVQRALAREPADRFTTAREMALAIEAAIPMAVPSKIGAWLSAMGDENLASLEARVAAVESDPGAGPVTEDVATPAGWQTQTLPSNAGGPVTPGSAPVNGERSTPRRSRRGPLVAIGAALGAGIVAAAAFMYRGGEPRTQQAAIDMAATTAPPALAATSAAPAEREGEPASPAPVDARASAGARATTSGGKPSGSRRSAPTTSTSSAKKGRDLYGRPW